MLKKIGKKWLLLGAFLICPKASLAASLKATVDANQVSLGESITLTVTADGDPDTDLSFPDLSAFEVSAGGTSTQMQFIQGKRSYQKSTSYILTPKKEGTYTLGSIRTQIDGVPVQTQPITVSVVKSASVEEAPSNNSHAYIQARVSKTQPYLGEGVLYTWRFYRKIQINNASLNLPSFEGFTTHDVGQQKDGQVVSNGEEYAVTEVQKLLFPVKDGTFRIESSSLQCEVAVRGQGTGDPFFDNFFGRHQSKRVVLKSDPISMKVLPLPAGAPEDFYGLVGQFNIEAGVDKKEAKTGESIVLNIRFTGQGNMFAIRTPSLSSLKDFKIYEDKPVSEWHAEKGGLTGSHTLSVVLVPLKEGDVTLPAMRLVYFDVVQKKYITRTTEPLVLKITQGTLEEPLKHVPIPKGGTLTKNDVKIENNTALLENVAAYTQVRAPSRTGLLAGFTLPPLFYIGGLLYQRKKRGKPDALSARKTAAKQVLVQIETLEKSTANTKEKADTLSKSARHFVGVCLNKQGLALTPEETYDGWVEAKNPGLAQAWKTFLQQCEEAQYGVQSTHVSQALEEELRSLVALSQKHFTA